MITVDGEVGAVGGVRQKVSRRRRADGGGEPARVFLVPRGNLAEARRAPLAGDLLLVPVDDLDDALAALEDVRAGRHPTGPRARRGPMPDRCDANLAWGLAPGSG